MIPALLSLKLKQKKPGMEARALTDDGKVTNDMFGFFALSREGLSQVLIREMECKNVGKQLCCFACFRDTAFRNICCGGVSMLPLKHAPSMHL